MSSQERLAVCHVAAGWGEKKEKEQMLERPPCRWLIHTHTHAHTQKAQLQKRPRFLPLSHKAGQKGRDILWPWVTTRWRSEKDGTHNLRVPVVCVRVEKLLFHCIGSWITSCFPLCSSPMLDEAFGRGSIRSASLLALSLAIPCVEPVPVPERLLQKLINSFMAHRLKL